MNHSVKNTANFFSHLFCLQLTILFTVNTFIYSYYLCMLFVIILQPKQGY